MPKNKKCQFKTKLLADYTCPESALTGSDYCIFHKPHKTKKDITLFGEAIDKKIQNKDYDFTGYHFPKGVDFANRVFNETASFAGSTFEETASFTGSTFEGDPYFVETTFKGFADFGKSTFKSHAHFTRSNFRDHAFFAASTFLQYTEFMESNFEKQVDFGQSTFRRIVWFLGSNFKGTVDFTLSDFLGYADFTKSVFESLIFFTGSTFNTIGIELDMISFKDNGSAEKFFRIAKTCSQKQGEYSLAGEYYYKERIAKRKQLPWHSPKRWFEYLLLDGLCGYGERPSRAIRTGLGVIFGLAILYWRIGHIYPSPELFKEPDHVLTFWDSLYFSVVTFTTLGFGDWRPDPSHWIRYVVMSEAFIGAFLMALFIVTFARRMMR